MIKYFQINDLILILTMFVRKKRKKINELLINEKKINKFKINAIAKI